MGEWGRRRNREGPGRREARRAAFPIRRALAPVVNLLTGFLANVLAMALVARALRDPFGIFWSYAAFLPVWAAARRLSNILQ